MCVDVTRELCCLPMYDGDAELEICDPDVKDRLQRMGTYMAGTPTEMQLVKELRLLRQAIEKLEVG